ncbi:hypothetical protein RhiirA1_487261 [Rhizophagus irregularis]|uniref:Uncharacterized protein n=1 Tax=Rhizophagus irregularis TaxID=588596 RepID=A0A2N0QGE7_9GLOM|nr:hypothetical protein RhiirA1_487261 [Rhizophagus irregularis]
MVQKNQPVLYWLEEVPFELIDNDDYILKCPERSFVREELMVIPFDTELPPQWFYDGVKNLWIPPIVFFVVIFDFMILSFIREYGHG